MTALLMLYVLSYAHLLILSSERAWAQAMQMKAIHSADPSAKGIVGATRRHIISRLNKAITYAEQLVLILQDKVTSNSTNIDLLEARAYLALLSGALYMEKQKWEECLQSYSVARVIYTILTPKERKDAFRDLVSGTIDPSLRYAAYQIKLPRTKPLPSVAIQFFPSDAKIRSEVETVDPACLTEDLAGTSETVDGEVQQLPNSITWRSRSVPLEDASIAQALAAAYAAESTLSSWMAEASGKSAPPKDKAAAYDSVIQASQDAVDATKTALDELAGEGVDRGDQRIQALQVTRTAVNYALVGWRVGRNRVLCGEQDGLHFEPEQVKAPRSGSRLASRQEGTGKKLARLRERVALYDSTLQSLDSVQELPGVAGDSEFVQELEAKRAYFRALRYVHSLLSLFY
jgi:signal recognition particle subunit SRP68